MAGEDDSFEAGFDRLLGIFFRLTPGVLAQRSVHVGVVEQSS